MAERRVRARRAGPTRGEVARIRVRRGGLEVLDGERRPVRRTVTVAAGQRVTLRVQARGGGEVGNVRWTLPDPLEDNAIARYEVSFSSSEVYPLDEQDFGSAEITFYWTSRGSKTVRVEADASGSRRSATVRFRVVAPDYQVFRLETSSVNVCPPGTYLDRSNPSARAHPWLAAFDPAQGGERNRGCRTTVVVRAPAGIEGSGEVGLVQLIRTRRTARSRESGAVVDWYLGTRGQWVLDQGLASQQREQRPQYKKAQLSAGGTATLETSDSPGVLLDPSDGSFEYDVEEDFRLYLTYKPPGRHSIWVTLAKAGWSWRGSSRRGEDGSWSAARGARLGARGPWRSVQLPVWSRGITEFSWQRR